MGESLLITYAVRKPLQSSALSHLPTFTLYQLNSLNSL